MLESVNLTCTIFDDVEMESLTNALANNCRLRKLKLRCNYNITHAGWQTLFQLLQRPSCRLESLDIGANNLTDETVRFLPVSLPTAAD